MLRGIVFIHPSTYYKRAQSRILFFSSSFPQSGANSVRPNFTLNRHRTEKKGDSTAKRVGKATLVRGADLDYFPLWLRVVWLMCDLSHYITLLECIPERGS